MMEHRSSMDAKEGEQCCDDDESNNDFADPGFDPFYRQELRPIKPRFFGASTSALSRSYGAGESARRSLFPHLVASS
jgi:hypothetical protein